MRAPANRLDPRVRLMWHAVAAGVAGVVMAIGFVTALLLDGPLWAPGAAIPGVVAAAFLVPDIRYRRWRYEIRARDVFVSKGVLFLTMALIPFDRIQFVETQQGPLDRLLSLTKLIVHTAGGKGSIPGLAIEEAESLREQLSRVAGTSHV